MLGWCLAYLGLCWAKFRSWIDPCTPLWTQPPNKPGSWAACKCPSTFFHVFSIFHNVTRFPHLAEPDDQTPNLTEDSAQLPQHRLDRPSEWAQDRLNVGQQSSRWAKHTVYSAPNEEDVDNIVLQHGLKMAQHGPTWPQDGLSWPRMGGTWAPKMTSTGQIGGAGGFEVEFAGFFKNVEKHRENACFGGLFWCSLAPNGPDCCFDSDFERLQATGELPPCSSF